MSDIEITKESIRGRLQNIVSIGINLEGNYQEDEFSYQINQFIGSLNKDDFDLIRESILENKDKIFSGMSEDEEMYIQAYLVESGEWQDVFWVKWYDVEKVVSYELR